MRLVVGVICIGLVGCTELKRNPPEQDTGMAGTAPSDGASAPADCQPPFCTWAEPLEEGCLAASMPTEDLRPPAAATDGQDLPPLHLGLTALSLSAPVSDDTPVGEFDPAWGFDLDGQCTGIQGCQYAASCVRDSAGGDDSLMPDGPFCADNAYSRIQAEVLDSASMAGELGLSEEEISCALKEGRYTQVLRLTRYNGEDADDDVRIDFYSAAGAAGGEGPCEAASDEVQWDSSAAWQILENDLTAPMSTSSGLPSSKVATADAFVRDGHLVAFVPRGYQLKLIGMTSATKAVRFELHEMVLVARLTSVGDGTYALSDGAIAGRQAIGDVVRSLGQVGICPEGGDPELYATLSHYVERSADLPLDSGAPADAPCDAVSTAFSFEARPVTPGDVVAERQLINCCLRENAGRDGCPAQPCGDGVVSDDERCDTAIPAGEPGACPSSCPTEDACTARELQGTGCDARCVETTIEAPKDGDDCCPPDATSANDADCDATCGNGTVETAAGETCDPPETCPTSDSCQSDSACVEVVLTGAPQTCDARCEARELTACESGDGCCPAGCDPDSDDDCSTTCGDGQLDSGEICDADCPTVCDDAVGGCQTVMLVGDPDQCSAQCLVQDVTRCADADGCCPAGCHGENDDDCEIECGNGFREADEECDDGNDEMGDGCHACLLETPERACQEWTDSIDDVSAECLDCVCRICGTELVACFEVGTEFEQRMCRNLGICRLQTWCKGTDCLFDSTCKEEIWSAGMSTDVFQLIEIAETEGTVLHRAASLEICTLNECDEPCNPRGGS